MMTNVWAVIRREYLQRVRSRWFIISTIGGPVLMAGLIFLPAYFAAQDAQAERIVAVLDQTDALYERVAPRLDEAGYDLREEDWSSDAVAELSQKVTDGELGAVLLLDEETLRTGEAVFYASSRPSLIRRVALQNAIAQSALEEQLAGQAVDVGALLSGGELRVELLSEAGAGMDDPQFLVAYIGAFFLYMVIIIYAVSVMRATLEEKTSRVVEVVISSMKPWHLMLGKILGVGAVGLTQMTVWIVSGTVIASMGLPAMIAARPEISELAQLREVLPGLGMLALFVGFFICGYFIFSGLYAAIGAMCNSDEEAQQAQWPLLMLLIVPIVFVTQVIENPAAPLAVGLSLFPFFSPILMFARVAGGGAPAWQVALSFVLMAGTIVAVAWVAGRIYKVGILMAGKRPTLPELWRWVKEA